MLTPWAPLTLVHAVEMPLKAPVVDLPTEGLKRQPGETLAALSGQIVNHAKSTGRLEVEATWEEPIDDVLTDGPSTLVGPQPCRRLSTRSKRGQLPDRTRRSCADHRAGRGPPSQA